jgi:multimeric flavodoxin WrbA
MKITVLGGSPKGETSVTMQYVKYLTNRFPQQEFNVVQVAQPIKKLEQNSEAFQRVVDHVRSSEGVLWAFPLYVFLVCSQYKRFIELIWEKQAAGAFKGKYAASLSTSIHFFDHTAHNYIRAVSEDLGMSYVGSHSCGMHDLLGGDGREMLLQFARGFFTAVEQGVQTPRLFRPMSWSGLDYMPAPEEGPKLTTEKKIVLLTDTEEGNTGKMIERFNKRFESPVEVINLGSIDIKGGCLGCLRCADKNECVYLGRDEYIDMYNAKLKTADILVFAGSIRDRYLSSRWKMFFDRAFFNTHQRSLEHKQFGFLISGPLSQAADLREILTAFVEWQGSNLVDIVSDESMTSGELDAAIDGLGARLVQSAAVGYVRPVSFLGVGGTKIFRDDIKGGLKVVFRADHKNYRKSGMYDFPQNKPLKNLLLSILYLVTGIPWVKKRMIRNFKEFMITPYRRVVNA